MQRFAKAMLGVSAGLLVFAALVVVGIVDLLNTHWFLPLAVVCVCVASVAQAAALVFCLVRLDWRNASFLLVALVIALAIPVTYVLLLYGSFA